MRNAPDFESSGYTWWTQALCGNNDFVGLLQYSLQKLKLLLAEWSVVKSSFTVSFYHVVDTLILEIKGSLI